ncbi:MAG: hypothetical protein J6Z74_01790 [Eubacterium sp.]|nr:hypothetical protein [Eubacterium sp.]
MRKTKRNAIVTVSAVAMMGLLSLGMVKVVSANSEANKVMASTQAADVDFAKAQEDFKAQQLEVTTEEAVTKKTNDNKVVKAAETKVDDKKTETKKTETKKTETKKAETKKATKKAGKYDEYFNLNGAATPEDIANMGPDAFAVSDTEWAKAKAEWMKLNPEYDEAFAEGVRGEYETAKWLEIIEYYGISESDNDQGWDYTKNMTQNNDATVENVTEAEPCAHHVSDEECEAAKLEFMNATGCSEEEAEQMRGEYEHAFNCDLD